MLSVAMHPIVREFVDSNEHIPLILEKHFDKNDFLEIIFLKLTKETKLFDVEPQLFLELDQAILKGHSDPSVYLLFISYSIYFTCPRKQIERANAIHSIGTSISLEKIHPLIQVFFIQSIATLRSLELKYSESNRLLKESLTLIDNSSPRYIKFIKRMAVIYSQQGRLKDLDKKDLDLLDSIQDESEAIGYISSKIENSTFTGNVKEGISLLEEYKRRTKGYKTYTFINDATDILNILSGDFDEKKYEDELIKSYVNVLNSVKLNKFEEARNYYKKLKNIYRTNWLELPFEEYLLLNIELCLKNKGMARLLYTELIEKGNLHYFDDFYLARLQLLEMNKEGAIESFARLVENLKRYGALSRLLFELQFAKEMKNSDILFLMNSIKNKPIIEISKTKNVLVFKSNQNEKGINLLVGESLAINKVKNLVKKFASLKEPVLITGETGTGKELVSRAIHDEGAYPIEPFLAINCGALTESLLQSELFGYVAGAFTGAQKERKGIFEAAGKGTVFLDEFGDISPKMQVSLLRVLESNEIRPIGATKTRQIECKMVIATNIDLHQAVEEKKFREDLFFRLTRFDIRLPALRDRVEDIPKLIDYFLIDKNNQNKNYKKLSKELLETLMSYRWPGNIRELKNEIERLKILHPDKEIINIQDFDFVHLYGEPPVKKELPIKKMEVSPQISIEKKIISELNLKQDQILEIMQRTSKSESRKRIIKELFQTYKKLTRIQIVEITSMNPGSISKELQDLCKVGFLTKVMPTKSVKSTYFVLKE